MKLDNYSRLIYVSCLFILIFLVSFLGLNLINFSSKEIISPKEINEGKKKRFQDIRSACKPIDYYLDSKNCPAFNKKYNILVIGNSHEVDGFNLLREAFTENNYINLIPFGDTNKCENFENNDRKCLDRFKHLDMMFKEKKITDIFISLNKPFNKDKDWIYEYISKKILFNQSLRVFILGGFINNIEYCPILINSSNDVDSCFHDKNILWFPNNEPKKLKFEFTYIDKMKSICPNLKNNCDTHLVFNNKIIPYSYDLHHHSYEYSQLIGKKLKKKINDYFK